MRKDHDRTLGYIYFVSNGDAVKIGWTQHVMKRIAALQTPISAPLTLLATVAARRSEETLMHNRFGHLRVRGEWFKSDPAITDYIEGLRRMNLVIDVYQHREEQRETRLRRRYQKVQRELRLSTSR